MLLEVFEEDKKSEIVIGQFGFRNSSNICRETVGSGVTAARPKQLHAGGAFQEQLSCCWWQW
jgi:hypothetical protein